MKVNKRKTIKVIVVLMPVIFFILYVIGWKIYMYGLVSRYDMPKSAEMVLEPDSTHWACCGGCVTTMEFVYRLPEENKADVKNAGNKISRLREVPCFEGECLEGHYLYGDDSLRSEGFYKDDGYYYIHVIFEIDHGGHEDTIFTLPLYFI